MGLSLRKVMENKMRRNDPRVIPFAGVAKQKHPDPPVVQSTPLELSEQRVAHDQCAHKRISVSELHAEVMCQDCGEKLNPVGVLLRYAKEESRLVMRIEENRKILAKLENKVRTKCEHCGQMTRVRA